MIMYTSKKGVYTNPLNIFGHGGGKIKRKLIFAVLIFLALTLALSANTVSAVSQNQTNATDKVQTTTQQVNTDTSNKTEDSTEKVTTTNSTGTTSTTSKSSTSSKNTSSSNNESQIAAGSAAGSTTTIKVLIYNGAYASANCVSGLKTILSNANSNNLVSGVKFTYTTTTKITSSILSGYDVLIMPGGSGGYYYLNSGSISASAIKSFVANGGGYIGICAGAYAAVASVDGKYNGWGIAPNVNAKVVSYVGNLAMQFTSAGTQLLGRSGTITVNHYNGAAMYTTSSTAKILATYADSKTGYKGYADIVSDYYGEGRSVLLGSHLELSPQYPDILAKLIAWAADVSTESSTTTVSVSQVASAASSVKSFIESNQRLPNYVTISGEQVTMSEFLYLLTTGTIQVNSGSTTAITVKNVDSATNSTENVESGNILKSEYLKIAESIQNFINTNGRAPNYATTTLGKISYESLIYVFSRIVAFYDDNNRLPNYVSVKSWSSQTGGSTTSGSTTTDSSLQKYLVATSNAQSTSSTIKNLAASIISGKTTTYAKAQAIFNWVRDNVSYSFYYNTQKGALGTYSSRSGNCCDMAHLVVALARAAGIPARYQHGTCTFSSGTYGHVWAQLYVNGKWYYADAVSTRNTFGTINNWNLNTYTLHGTYAELPF